MPDTDLKCDEALNADIDLKYDVVLADSVFQYFNDVAYGQSVLQRMWDKADKMVVIRQKRRSTWHIGESVLQTMMKYMQD